MITFRVDDIGSCSKHFNQYGTKTLAYKGRTCFYFPLANVGFFKRTWPFKGWARYDELVADEWCRILKVFRSHRIRPLIAITACWVDELSRLIPFPEKFPEPARVLKVAFEREEIAVANHGLTHCVVGKHLPRFWTSNQTYHREFWPWLDESVHREHVFCSQSILEGYFGREVTAFVPPGNLWSVKTYRALMETNIRKVIARRHVCDGEVREDRVEFVNDRKGFCCMHDRELKLYGVRWLEARIQETRVASA